VQIPQPGVPQIMTMEGRFVRAAYNNEGYVILGYQLVNRSLGEEWDAGVLLGVGSAEGLAAELKDRADHAVLLHFDELKSFVDKARAILPHYPAGTRLVFIVGFDTLVRLFDPKYYADPDAALAALFATCEFVAANRAPEPTEAVAAFLRRPDVATYASAIRTIELPGDMAAISATEVRKRLARGEPVDPLVPPEVLPLLQK